MPVTVRTICTQALRKIRVLAAGETIETADCTEVSDELRRMLDAWRLENLMIVSTNIESFDLDSSKNTYTIYDDPAADFETPRPVAVLSATLRDGSGRGWPLAPMTSQEWSESSSRSIQAQPSRFYYHAAHPIASVRLDAMPDTAWPTIELTMDGPFEISTVEEDWDDAIVLAPGYENAIIYNLAVAVHEDFGVPLPKTTGALAMGHKKLIKRANFEVPTLDTDEIGHTRGVRGTYDINRGPV
jgi:hypothetical protein